MMNLVKEQTMMKQTKKEVIERSLVDRAKEHHFTICSKTFYTVCS
jgi:hypothetical protein